MYWFYFLKYKIILLKKIFFLFFQLIEKDEFIEFGLYNGEYYGTSKSELSSIFKLGKV